MPHSYRIEAADLDVICQYVYLICWCCSRTIVKNWLITSLWCHSFDGDVPGAPWLSLQGHRFYVPNSVVFAWGKFLWLSCFWFVSSLECVMVYCSLIILSFFSVFRRCLVGLSQQKYQVGFRQQKHLVRFMFGTGISMIIGVLMTVKSLAYSWK